MSLETISKLDFFRSRNCDGPITTTCQLRDKEAMFIGDSITREISEEAARVYKAVTFVSNVLVTPSHLNSTKLRGKCISVEETHRAKTIVWVGGNAVHFLLRTHDKKDPIGAYVHQINPILHFLKKNCVNSVLIGPISLDESLFMSPAKHDWRNFDDFSLLHLWHQQAKTLAARHGITYFDTQQLVRRHEKCRCDGMHFGSAFHQWNCTSSRHLWRHEICRQIVANNR